MDSDDANESVYSGRTRMNAFWARGAFTFALLGIGMFILVNAGIPYLHQLRQEHPGIYHPTHDQKVIDDYNENKALGAATVLERISILGTVSCGILMFDHGTVKYSKSREEKG